jgi:hypothetical protein
MASAADDRRWIFTAEQLENTPSIQDGMSKEQVSKFRPTHLGSNLLKHKNEAFLGGTLMSCRTSRAVPCFCSQHTCSAS